MNELEQVTAHLRVREQENSDLQARYALLLDQAERLKQGDSKYYDQLSKSMKLGEEIEKLANLVRQQADEVKNLKNRLAESEEAGRQSVLLIQTLNA